MKSEMKRWTDEEKFFWVRTCIKPNLVLSEISEMKRWRVRWRNFFFWSEHVSSQIWCYLKLVRWRVRWRWRKMNRWNLVLKFFFSFGSEHVSSQIWCYLKLVRWRVKSEMNRWRKFFWVRTCIKPNLVLSEISEMKRWRVRWRDEENFFWVWTCIKPNLVLSEISEMKRWRVRWTDEENFFGSEHVSSQIWWYLKLVRWRDEEWDEEMKKIFFGSEHVSSQIWCYLKLVRWRDEEWTWSSQIWCYEQMKKIFFWVRTCIKPNLVSSEISEMKRWRVRWRDEQMKKFFWGLNMYQAKSGVIWN